MGATTYEGPFDTPPAELLPEAIGWRFVKQHVTGSRWVPVAWEIVFAGHILTVDYSTKMAIRNAVLHTP